MEIKVRHSFKFSDLMAQPGVILVQDEVEIFRGNHDASILAGVCLPDGDGKGMAQVLTIEFHYGRAAWHLKVEHSIQKATELCPGLLPDLIQMFETKCGVSLPLIKVIEVGVGIYSAQARYASENPWAMVNGGFYTVTDPKQGKRMFVADVRNGRTLISFVDEKLQSVTETFEPAVVLSAADWKSLEPMQA